MRILVLKILACSARRPPKSLTSSMQAKPRKKKLKAAQLTLTTLTARLVSSLSTTKIGIQVGIRLCAAIGT